MHSDCNNKPSKPSFIPEVYRPVADGLFLTALASIPFWFVFWKILPFQMFEYMGYVAAIFVVLALLILLALSQLAIYLRSFRS